MNGSLRRQPTYPRRYHSPRMVFPPNDVWERGQKSHTDDASLTQIWIGLPIGCSKFSTNQKHVPCLSCDTSSEWNLCSFFLTPLCGKTSGDIEKCLPFSKAILKADDVKEIWSRFGPLRLISKRELWNTRIMTNLLTTYESFQLRKSGGKTGDLAKRIFCIAFYFILFYNNFCIIFH